MREFDESKHRRNKRGRFAKMSARELSEELKIDINHTAIDNEKLKSHYNWAVEHGYVSPLVSYELYQSIAEGLHKIAIGKIAADGTMIKKITNHCIDRVCGTIEKENGVKHEGVSLEDFESTLFKGKVRIIAEDNTIIFISDKCKIAINPQKGDILQCNKI